MRITLRAITQNWQLKVAAVALAVLLWVVVSAEQVTTQWIPVPVRVAPRNPEYVVTGGPIPREVEVRFAGPGRELWELAIDRPVLVLPLNEVDEENQVFVLDPRMVRIPNGLSVTPLDVRPSSVRVLTQRVVSRDLPVRVRIARRSQERYMVLDTPQVTPATVRVSGPASQVSRLDAVVTEPVDLGTADSTFTTRVSLDADSLGGLQTSAGVVEVAFRVDRIVERILPSIAVEPLDGVEIVPGRVDVRVQGPSRQVRALDPAGLTVSVLVDSIPPGASPAGAAAPVRVDGLPPGITARTVPVMVRVSLPDTVTPPEPDTVAAPLAEGR